MDLNTTLKRLRCVFYLYVALLCSLALLSWLRGGTTIITEGYAYGLQSTFVIICIAAMVLAWKLMTIRKVRAIVARRSEDGLRAYYTYSVIRMTLLAAPATLGYIASGFRIDDTNASLAIMLSVAMLMFYPTQLLYNHDTREQ